MSQKTKMISHQNDNILIDFDPNVSPESWVNGIFANIDYRTAAQISKNLVAAILQKRFLKLDVRTSSKKTGYNKSGGYSAITIGSTIYHLTTKPNVAVIRECKQSLSAGYKTILLAPNAKIKRILALFKKSGIANRISIFSIEKYISLAIILISCDKNVKLITTFKNIVREYNRRIHASETERRFKIELLQIMDKFDRRKRQTTLRIIELPWKKTKISSAF